MIYFKLGGSSGVTVFHSIDNWNIWQIWQWQCLLQVFPGAYKDGAARLFRAFGGFLRLTLCVRSCLRKGKGVVTSRWEANKFDSLIFRALNYRNDTTEKL